MSNKRERRVVSYSELDALKQCPLKAHLQYTERWTSSEPSKALDMGKVFHNALENHYNKLKDEAEGKPADIGLTPEDAFLEAEENIMNPEWLETVRWMWEGYHEFYGSDPNWTVHEVESKEQLWLPTRTGRKSEIDVKTKIDLLVTAHDAGGGLWLVDHKTCKDLPKQKDLDFDDQFGLYVWMYRKKGIPVRGVIHNAVRTYKLKRDPQPLEERFKRTYTVRTDTELDNIARETYEWFSTQHKPVDGELPRRSTNPDTCGWRCSYTEACLMSRKGGDLHELLEDMGCTQDFTRH
jgi:RecB family exonuclease